MTKIRIDLAYDGQQALGKLTKRNNPPDFIFLDVNMPGMTGVQCLQELKATPQLSQIPVIMYTTTADKNTRKLCIVNGAQDYIVKPNSFTEVVSILKQVFKKDYIPIFKQA